MKQYAASHHIACAVLLCVCLVITLSLGGCGKSGMPLPKKTQDNFTITGQNLAAMGNCLVASGTVTGAIQNVSAISLEIAPIDVYGDCPGCPFVAREYGEYSPAEAQLDLETGQFMFSFCPIITAPMYRWRVVGKNVFHGLPVADTTPQVMTMP